MCIILLGIGDNSIYVYHCLFEYENTADAVAPFWEKAERVHKMDMEVYKKPELQRKEEDEKYWKSVEAKSKMILKRPEVLNIWRSMERVSV